MIFNDKQPELPIEIDNNQMKLRGYQRTEPKIVQLPNSKFNTVNYNNEEGYVELQPNTKNILTLDPNNPIVLKEIRMAKKILEEPQQNIPEPTQTDYTPISVDPNNRHTIKEKQIKKVSQNSLDSPDVGYYENMANEFGKFLNSQQATVKQMIKPDYTIKKDIPEMNKGIHFIFNIALTKYLIIWFLKHLK